MKTILVTTRDYYSLPSSPDSVIEAEDVLQALSMGIFPILSEMRYEDSGDEENEEDEEDNSSQVPSENDTQRDAIYTLFQKNHYEDETNKSNDYKEFWEKWHKGEEKFPLKVVRVNDEYCVIVAPCFPKNFDDKNYSIRHLFVRLLINKVIDAWGTPAGNDFYIIAHEKDLYIDNRERVFNAGDFLENDVLQDQIGDDKIPYNNVFGFQHKRESGTVYSIFVSQLNGLNADHCAKLLEKIGASKESMSKLQELDNYPFTQKPTYEGLRKIINELTDKKPDNIEQNGTN